MTHREMIRASMHALNGENVIARFSTHRDAVYAFNEYVRWLKDIRAGNWTARKSTTPTVMFGQSVGKVVFMASAPQHSGLRGYDLFDSCRIEDVLR